MSILQLISWLLGSAAVGLGVFLVFSGWLSDWLAGNRRQPRCRKCWYPMTVPGQLVCPECGWNAPDEAAKHRSRRFKSRMALGAAILLIGSGATLWPLITLPGWTAGLPLSMRLRTHRYLHTEPQLFLLLKPANLTAQERALVEDAAMANIRRAGYAQRLIGSELACLEQIQSTQQDAWLKSWAELIEHGDPGTLMWFTSSLLQRGGYWPAVSLAPADLRVAAERLADPKLGSDAVFTHLMLSSKTDEEAEAVKALGANRDYRFMAALLARGPAAITQLVSVFNHLPIESKDDAAQALAAGLAEYRRTHRPATNTSPPVGARLFTPLIEPTLALCTQGWPPNGNGVSSLVSELSQCAEPAEIAGAMAQAVRDASDKECAGLARAFNRIEARADDRDAWQLYIAAWFEKLASENTARDAGNVLERLPHELQLLNAPLAEAALQSPQPWTRYYATRLYQRAIWYRRPRPLEPLKALAENPAELQAIRLRAIYLLTELGESSAKPWETKLDP